MTAFAHSVDPAFVEFARELRASLSRRPQREIPCRYLYDDVGSALFEAITVLPEYGLSRADERIIRANAGPILDRAGRPPVIAELGSGSGRKTQALLRAAAGGRIRYVPIDLSVAALEACQAQLVELRHVRVEPVAAEYAAGLRELRRRPGDALLVLFLGSSIGNFSRAAALAFLREIRSLLLPGDSVLVGADLIKEIDRMVLAYDDPAGVTAAFNRNLLARANREAGADFDLGSFAHEARWNAAEQRIEMHLVSTRTQAVRIELAGFTFSLEAGETIRTEECHKYTLEDLEAMVQSAGFVPDARWVDCGWPFVELLCVVT